MDRCGSYFRGNEKYKERFAKSDYRRRFHYHSRLFCDESGISAGASGGGDGEASGSGLRGGCRSVWGGRRKAGIRRHCDIRVRRVQRVCIFRFQGGLFYGFSGTVSRQQESFKAQ